MVTEEFKILTPQELCAINEKGCWSIENMPAHGAEDSRTEYIGSHMCNVAADGSVKVLDYYRDEQGRFWYQNRVRLNGGRMISEKRYALGWYRQKN